MVFNEVIQRLEAYTDHPEWERLCCDVLSQLGYRGIEPQSVGGKDGGKDAVVWNTSLGNVAVHMSLRKDWKTKLFEDLEKTKGKDFQKVIFCTNQKISGISKDNLKLEVKKKYLVDFDIFDRERFRVEIENNRPDLFRKLGLSSLELYIKNADLLSVPLLERPKKLEILQKYVNSNLSKSDKIQIDYSADKPQISIKSGIIKNIKIFTKFKFKKEKLEGHVDFQKFLEAKLSEGEDVIFTEDEIEEVKIDNPNAPSPEGNPTMLKISPEPIDKEMFIDLEIPGSDIYYEKIRIAPISRKEKYAVIRSFDSSLVIILKVYGKIKDNKGKLDFVFKLDAACNDLRQGVKFNKFVRDLNSKKFLIIKESSTQKIILDGSLNKQIEYDEFWSNIIADLYFIGQKLNIVFPLPRVLTALEITIITETKKAIETKKMVGYMQERELEFSKENAEKFIKNYEKKGAIHGAVVNFGAISSTLLGKEIKLDGGSAVLPTLKIVNDLDELKKSLKTSDKIKIKVDSVNKNEIYEINLTELNKV